MEITEKFYAKDRATWREWLERNHDKRSEIWLIYYKKGSGKSRVSYSDALDEALCFGWIDGQTKGIDSESYAQRFTPRTKDSKWSVININRYAKLLEQGLVSEYGQKVFNDKKSIYDPRVESVIYAIRDEFKKISSPERAELAKRYFKTAKGEYGYGDKFYGATVPETRAIAHKYCDKISFSRITYMLESSWHEERQCMLFVLVAKFKKADENERKKIFDFYLKHTKGINNWDLVDLSAYFIVGEYLIDKPRDILYKLVISENIWERRIAIVSTFAFIKKGESLDTLKIAEILLNDKHDLIQKAVGWMLREVGKKCGESVLLRFLDKYSAKMPRTMLRYAIEKLSQSQRRHYLK